MEELLARCIRGDEQAWCRFVDRYAPVIYAAVRRVLAPRGAQGSTSDVVQDVFVRLVRDNFRLLRNFDTTRASLVTYLTVIAVSTACDSQRRKKLDTFSLQDQHDLAAPDQHEVLRLDVPSDLLSPRQQLVLTLLYDRQMAVSETAKVLGITQQSVRSVKHKAISKLRTYFRHRP